MKILLLLSIFLLQGFFARGSIQSAVEVEKHMGHAYQDGKVLRLPLNETASVELLEKWMSQAVSGFMAALASQRLDRLSSEEKENMQICSKEANSVPQHAKCVVRILDSAKASKDSSRKPLKETKIKMFQEKWKNFKETKIKMESKNEVKWLGGFGQMRMKRETNHTVINKGRYVMRNEQDETIMTQLARRLTKNVRRLKEKVEGNEKWRDTVIRVKEIGERAKEEKKAREELKRRLRMMIENSPKEYIDPRKPIAMKQIEMEEEDFALKEMEVKERKEEIRVPLKLLRDSIKMAVQLAGKNITGFDKKTLKLFSPRLLSIVPEQDPDSLFSLLSPSLFSLHEDGKEDEQALSLPQLLKDLKTKDQDAWLDFVVEAAGVNDAVVMTEEQQKMRKEKEMRGLGDVPLYFTKENATEIGGDVEKRKIEVFEELDRRYDQKQKADLDKFGYSFLTNEQLEIVYGRNSPYRHDSAFRRFKKMRLRDDHHRHIEHDVRALAEAEKFKMRRKDITLSPFLLTSLIGAGVALSQPVILSPLVLTPIILSPAVLGPIILSPWVFVPLILSPRVLSPLIVSPLVFSPIILSPLVLHPLILVPGVFNPLILSPLVLSPLILSPQVFTPLILSPMVLNPLILNPAVGSPLVLSPFVLSPLIVSPQVLFAVVLSPYVLSPLIESKLIASEVVLSPSWLS